MKEKKGKSAPTRREKKSKVHAAEKALREAKKRVQDAKGKTSKHAQTAGKKKKGGKK